MWTVIVLIVIEVALSVDNAVLNARHIGRLQGPWPTVFMIPGSTWALIWRITVPIVIVSLARLSLHVAADLFIPGAFVADARIAGPLIDAFGEGLLLLLAALYFLNAEPHTPVQRWLTHVGQWRLARPVCAVVILGAIAVGASGSRSLVETLTALGAGVVGILVAVAVDRLGKRTVGAVPGWILELTIELKDMGLSLDSVIAALAITQSPIAIAIGLGLGVIVTRALTLTVARRSWFKRSLVFVEPGAHAALLALGVLTLVNASSVVTGAVPALLILLSLGASVPSMMRARDS